MTSIKKIAYILLLVTLFSIPFSAYADLGIQGNVISDELKSRIVYSQKEFSNEIELARKSKNIDKVRRLFCLDGADKIALDKHGMLLEMLKNSEGYLFHFKELPMNFENFVTFDGKKYETTLPKSSLIGMFEMKIEKDNFKAEIKFPVGENDGKLCFSPFLVLKK